MILSDERGTNLTGIYDMLAQVFNEQLVLRAEREQDKKKIEALQRKVDLINTGILKCIQCVMDMP